MTFRGPELYDSNDGNYYVDPASTLVSLNINGGITINSTSIEQQISWTFSTRNVYLFGRDSDDVLGLYDTLAVNSRWYTDTSGNFAVIGEVVAYASDQRLKNDINVIENALEKINQISGVTFVWNNVAEPWGFKTDNKKDIGVIAQEVQKVLPEVVKPAPFDQGEHGISKSGENFLTVQYEKIVPLLIEGIKELSREVGNLKLQIAELKNHNI